MGDLEKKEALRKVLKDVRKAHKLIFEYQERILHIIEFIKKEVNGKYTTYHYPNREIRIYGDITEFFFGTNEDGQEKNVFCIILATGNNEEEQSELVFILDQNNCALPRNKHKDREYYLYNIIDRDKTVLNHLKKEDCVIQRRNIEDFYDEDALKKEWKEISNNFPSCWLNSSKETGKMAWMP